MTIHLPLQAVVSPPVLPNLQDTYPAVFSALLPMASLDFTVRFPHVKEKNTSSLGDLLKVLPPPSVHSFLQGFLHYVAELPVESHGVTLLGLLPRWGQLELLR